ncbi:MAG: MarR family winged helix-turn-helix transcriptional regulator [Saprospiraceae bacterium]
MSQSPFDLSHQNKSIESKIVASLERISQAFRVMLWNESKDFSLTPIQIQVLIFLLHHSEEKRKVTYLSQEFNMTKATISETIKILEQKKLISKESELLDTRSYIIHLTENGKNIAQQTSMFTKQLQVPIDKLNTEDKENLLLSLISVIQHLNESGIVTIQRMCFTCAHYKQGIKGQEHFCTLLNQKLERNELRIDCPEHLPK